ncbi:MAG: MacS family sensor histidine kinase, partial [Nocardioidaceae bacterium]
HGTMVNRRAESTPTTRPPTGTTPAAEQVETTLFRALAVLRIVVLVYVVALNIGRWHEFDHPTLGWVVIGAMVVWTGVVTWGYDATARRRLPLLIADLAVAIAALASTPYIQSDAMLARHASTMPSFWVMASVLAWAIRFGWVAGVSTAVLMSAADVAFRTNRNGTTWGNIFLLLLGAGIVGYAATLVRDAAEARARAERIAAAMQERARLARVVHDGVLQVLALVQKRGHELGGDAAELGRLAGEQEIALRALVQGDAYAQRRGAPAVEGATVDLVAELERLQSATVTVSGPGGVLRVPSHFAGELLAVVRACLDNVTKHVGPGARAWVLLEDLGQRVAITVRDEGPGIATGRLDEARDEGRLGVAESIRGRMADLGGTAELRTRPGQGTEWELSGPVR